MITLQQIRAARAMLNLKQNELALKAGVSLGTLNNIERGVQTDPKMSTLRALQQALESEGIEFITSPTGTIGIQLRPKKASATTATLLMIDDSNIDRQLYKTWLNKQPNVQYTILEASDAKSGYEAFVQHRPDCIILDFMMYGKNGFQLLVDMKNGELEVPPIVFVTGMHADVVEQNARDLGVSTYLNKNELTAEIFCEAVARALR